VYARYNIVEYFELYFYPVKVEWIYIQLVPLSFRQFSTFYVSSLGCKPDAGFWILFRTVSGGLVRGYPPPPPPMRGGGGFWLSTETLLTGIACE